MRSSQPPAPQVLARTSVVLSKNGSNEHGPLVPFSGVSGLSIRWSHDMMMRPVATCNYTSKLDMNLTRPSRQTQARVNVPPIWGPKSEKDAVTRTLAVCLFWAPILSGCSHGLPDQPADRLPTGAADSILHSRYTTHMSSGRQMFGLKVLLAMSS